MKKILFISHDASFSGAPLVLYNFLKRVKTNKDFEFEILFLKEGPIIPLFEKLTKTYLFSKNHTIYKRFLSKIIGKELKTELEIFLNNCQYDIIYINSSATLGRLPNLNFLKKRKSIIHMHELNINIVHNNVNELLRKQINNFNHVICVSKLVKSNLKNNYNLDESKASVIYPISRDVFEKNISKKNLGIHENSFVVGGCGHVDYTKSIDIFIAVAAKVIKREMKEKPIYFYWLGNNGNKYILDHIRADILKMNLSKKIKLIETTKNPEEIFKNYDVFFLSSREDSFPLVAIENAKLGNPVICFDKGNGFSEFIDDENGIIVPYFDIDKTAEQILRLYNDKKLRDLMGENIKKDSEKFDNEVIYRKLVNLINEC